MSLPVLTIDPARYYHIIQDPPFACPSETSLSSTHSIRDAQHLAQALKLLLLARIL